MLCLAYEHLSPCKHFFKTQQIHMGIMEDKTLTGEFHLSFYFTPSCCVLVIIFNVIEIKNFLIQEVFISIFYMQLVLKKCYGTVPGLTTFWTFKICYTEGTLKVWFRSNSPFLISSSYNITCSQHYIFIHLLKFLIKRMQDYRNNQLSTKKTYPGSCI
jgi:hypothetical protein